MGESSVNGGMLWGNGREAQLTLRSFFEVLFRASKSAAWMAPSGSTGTTELETDIFASSTCHCNIITLVHMKILILGNTGRCDVEIVLARSGGLDGMQVDNIKPLRLWSRCDGHCRKSSMRKWRNCTFKYSVRRFSFQSSRGFRRVSPVRGSPGTKKSELRAHQMARKFEVPGSPRTKIRAELSSNGSVVRPAGLTPHKKNHAEVLWNGDRWSERRPGSHERLPPRFFQCGASAGHVAVYNVMVMMVSNRRAPGATILGGALKYFTCQSSLLSPTDGSCTSWWSFWDFGSLHQKPRVGGTLC